MQSGGDVCWRCVWVLFEHNLRLVEHVWQSGKITFSDLKHVFLSFDQVTDCQKDENDDWIVSTSRGQYTSKFLIVCTGVHETPVTSPKRTIFGDFSGDICHSGEVIRRSFAVFPA